MREVGCVFDPGLFVILLTRVSLDYLFQLAVEMKKLGIPWLSDIPVTVPQRK